MRRLGENHRRQYQQALRHQRRRLSEFWAGTWRTAWRLGFLPQRTPAPGRFVGLSTRTLEKYRYKGLAIVEVMLNPDGLLRGDRLREASLTPESGLSPEDGERMKRVVVYDVGVVNSSGIAMLRAQMSRRPAEFFSASLVEAAKRQHIAAHNPNLRT
jgi:hypothetical protein